MFEQHRAKKALKAYQKALVSWQAQRDGYPHLLEVAEDFKGTSSEDILLSAGEALFYTVTSVSLIEERRGRGHYQGGSAGISIPVGQLGGHNVRYRVGASRGHYVQGAPTPTAIDTGTVYITNKRVIFQGSRQTRECAFTRLIGFQHSDDGSTTFSVSNRQKPTTIHYGAQLSASFDFRLDLALAHYQGTISKLVDQLRQDLATIDSQRPSEPAGVGQARQ